MARRKKGHLRRRCERAMYILDLPPEGVMGTFGIRIISSCYLRAENHRGILELKEDTVRLKTPEGECKLLGEKLVVELMERDSINIRGKINTVEFIAGGEKCLHQEK